MGYTSPTKKARVVELRKDGLTFDQIGARLNIDRSTASRIHARYGKTLDFYSVKYKSGRPHKLTEQDVRLGARLLAKTVAKDAVDLQRQAFPQVNAQMV